MATRPSKYPDLDPREPGIYGRILAAAAAMRAKQQAEAAIGRIMALQRMNARANARADLEDAEPVVKVMEEVK